MPIYSKGRNQWHVVVRHRGKRADRKVRGTKKDAQAVAAQLRLDMEAGEPVSVSPAIAFSDFCLQRYRPHALAHLKSTTWERVRKYQVATLIEHFGPLRLTEIDVEAVERYKTARLRQGISPNTINDEWKVLRAILGYALDLGVIRRVPRVKLLPTPGKGRVTAWNPDEVAALYRAVESVSPDLMPLVVCLLNTGMRKGEALALERDSLDLDRDLIRVWPSEHWQPKDKRPREIPINAALRPWLTRASGRWVFPSSQGSRYAYWPQRAFDRARKQAGLTGGPHTTRHTFASEFLANDGKLYELARILGHSVRETTDRYAHFSRDYLDESRGIVSFAPAVGAAEWTARKHWGGGDK